MADSGLHGNAAIFFYGAKRKKIGRSMILRPILHS